MPSSYISVVLCNGITLPQLDIMLDHTTMITTIPAAVMLLVKIYLLTTLATFSTSCMKQSHFQQNQVNYNNNADGMASFHSVSVHNPAQNSYLDFFNHTTTTISSGNLQGCDDCISQAITLPGDFPFGNYYHQTAYVRN